MIAARIPAVRNPPSTAFVWLLTKYGNTAFGLMLGGSLIVAAQIPIRTHGTQTIMMKTGWHTTGTLNDRALFAVNQC